MSDDEVCKHIVRQGNYFNPPEYCEEDALPNSEYCAAHQEDKFDYDDDDPHGEDFEDYPEDDE